SPPTPAACADASTCDEPHRRPARHLPRRADDGARPAGASGGVGCRHRARPGRHNRTPHDAGPGRGRESPRPDSDPSRGTHHRRRHPGRAQATASPGEGRVRREAAEPGRRLPGPHQGGGIMTTQPLGDTAVLTGRSLRHILRSPDTIITTAVTPVAIMALFVFVFGGAIDTGSYTYIDYMLPGILLITSASGIAYTAYRLFMDLQGGIFER